MELCCLLSLCCPPAARRAKLLDYYVSKGVEASLSERMADDLIVVFDKLLASPLGHLIHEGRK